MTKNKGTSFFSDTRRTVLLAVLIALLILMNFTPLGFTIRIGLVSITFLCIPIAVGACLLGPAAGAALGAVFGFLSLFQALSGMDAFGAALVAAQPVYTVIACLIPRVLCGLLPGIFFKIMSRRIPRQAACAISGFLCSFLNTLLFCGTVYLLFRNVDYAGGKMGTLIVIAGATNGIPEAIACLILCTAICTAIFTYSKRRKRAS